MDIERLIRLLIIRLCVTYILFFIVIVGGVFRIEYHLREKVAESVTSSVRENVISNSLRSAMIGVGAVVDQFTQIRYFDHKKETKFVLPDDGPSGNLFEVTVTKNLYADREMTKTIGGFVFLYNALPSILAGFLIWLVTLLFGIPVYLKSKKQIYEAYQNKLKVETALAREMVASQVAHDIRSPLAALRAVVSQSKSIEEKNKEILEKSALRISDIAENLLKVKREGVATASTAVAVELKTSIVEIVNEKKILHPEIKFLTLLEEHTAKVVLADFKRIISNLLNNSIEALSNEKQEIVVTLKRVEQNLMIIIADTGKGIGNQILKNLFSEGATFGKVKGNGLGLFHAKRSIESWGGAIILESTVGVGTTVTITLPAIELKNEKIAILIDDDALVRLVWESKAKNAGVNLKTFENTKEFEVELSKISKETEIYIDRDLPDGVKGEDYAKKLFDQGFTNITLATGHERSFFGELPHIKKIIGKEAPW